MQEETTRQGRKAKGIRPEKKLPLSGEHTARQLYIGPVHAQATANRNMERVGTESRAKQLLAVGSSWERRNSFLQGHSPC